MLTCQDVAMVGTAPILMASKNDCVRPANMGPVITIEPICFGLALSKMSLVKASSPALNSGRILSICKVQISPSDLCCMIQTWRAAIQETDRDNHMILRLPFRLEKLIADKYCSSPESDQVSAGPSHHWEVSPMWSNPALETRPVLNFEPVVQNHLAISNKRHSLFQCL